MSLPREFEGLDHVVLPRKPLHLAIGIFDGVHLGHRAVIEAAVHSARCNLGTAAVLTFAPHPSVVLRPDQPTRMIMDRPAKARLLGELGIDAVITQPFTPEFAQTSAEEFLPWLKARLPQLAAVYVGENWRFGRGRGGDIAFLVAEGKKHGITVFSAPRVNLNGEPINSSRIRTLIETGDMAGANRLLGYVYFAEGVIASGKRLGRTLGFPTLNLVWSPDLRPRFGVYVVRVSGAKSAQALRGVANYGLRPTVEQSTEPRLETHVLDDCPYTAGDTISVEWLHFLRPEKKFAGVDELRGQIARDLVEAKTFFDAEPHD
ncbi:MAG: riboflavin biosynthesis protein RibF [Opitutus sp.]